MTVMPREGWSESDQKAVREQLGRILKSGPFHGSQRRQRFLQYIVNESLAGRGERLKGYNIAVEVFDRPESFDPVVDPLVRIEAARLRDKLREYYAADGECDPIRIELPKGTYTPQIEFRQPATLDPTVPLVDGAMTDASGPISRRSALPKIGWHQLGMLAAAVLLIIAASFWGMKGWNSGPSLPDKPSIAVLPFDNMGTIQNGSGSQMGSPRTSLLISPTPRTLSSSLGIPPGSIRASRSTSDK